MAEQFARAVDSTVTHLLIHGSGDGVTQYMFASSLEEAITHAEYLANQRDDETSRIFEMREVSIAYKTYYRVEVSRSAHDTQPDPDIEHDGPRVVAVSA